MMPRGELNLIGIQMREMFIRGTLDWIGVKPNMEAIGIYKSAKNLFTEKDFTPAQREEDEALIESFYQQLVGQIGKAAPARRRRGAGDNRSCAARRPGSAQGPFARPAGI